MKKLLLLADDLTGTLDTGVFFSGLDASVSLNPDKTEDLICLSSRHLSREEAFQRTSLALSENPSENKYLKTDSLLRGHIGASLEALYKHSGTVFFAPAYPAAGRTTVDGIIYVYGTRLTQTENALDIRNPVKNDEAASIIAEETDLPVCVIAPDDDIDPSFHGIIVCDAESDEDLEKAANAAINAGIHNFAGCAGFARALSAAMNVSSAAPDKISPSRIFVISASAHPASLEQLGTARSFGVPGIWIYDGGHSEDLLEAAEKKALRFAKTSPCSILAAAFSDIHCSKNSNYFRSKHISSEDAAEQIVRETARCAAKVLSRCSSIPFVIGGDTLSALCKEMGIVSIMPRFSISQGIIYSIYTDKNGRKKPIITKAGSFGNASVIVDISDIMTLV